MDADRHIILGIPVSPQSRQLFIFYSEVVHFIFHNTANALLNFLDFANVFMKLRVLTFSHYILKSPIQPEENVFDLVKIALEIRRYLALCEIKNILNKKRHRL